MMGKKLVMLFMVLLIAVNTVKVSHLPTFQSRAYSYIAGPQIDQKNNPLRTSVATNLQMRSSGYLREFKYPVVVGPRDDFPAKNDYCLRVFNNVAGNQAASSAFYNAYLPFACKNPQGSYYNPKINGKSLFFAGPFKMACFDNNGRQLAAAQFCSNYYCCQALLCAYSTCPNAKLVPLSLTRTR